jgi:3-deoxy-manno-octulosonate cytidylyltransferase (CMP-KDO synthetase)
MATLAVPLTSIERWQNPNCTKVVCDDRGRALYFSRSPIPYVRDGQLDFAAQPPQFLQHLGVYAYRRAFLLRLAAMEPAPLEQLEKLEQLRALALGRAIQVGIVAHSSPGVDTYQDYQEFVQIYRNGLSSRAA